MAETLASVNVRVGAKIEQLEKGLKKAERALLRSGRQMSRTGRNLTQSLSLPIVAAGAASLKFAADFETSFLKINTLVGVSGDTLEQFRQGIADLSGPLGQSQTKLSDALFVITSAGQRGAEALETLEAASKASAIGLGATTDIARAAVAATQAYGSETLSTAAAVDKLTAIVRSGNLEASELAPALGRVLPIASQLGVSFDEVGANIATFTRLGVSASESVTALKSLLSNLLKPSKQAAKELARLGISADDLRASVANNGLAATLDQLITAYDGNTEGLARLFGNVEGLANALGTAGAQGKEYKKIVDEIAKSNGIVNEGFEKVSQTANFKLKQSLLQLQGVGVQLGGTLVPVVTDVLNAVTPLVSAFSKLSPTLQKTIVSFSLLTAALGPLISVYGNLKTVIGSSIIAYDRFKLAIKAARGQMALNALTIAEGKNAYVGLGSAINGAAVGFNKLNTVAKASLIVAVAAAVAYLAKTLYDVYLKSTDAAVAQKKLNEQVKETQTEIGRETSRVGLLFDKLKDLNTRYEERKTVFDELKNRYPTYLGNLDIEKATLGDIETAQKKVNKEIIRAAALRQKANDVSEIAGEIASKRLRITQVSDGAKLTFDEASRVNLAEMAKFGSVAGGVVNELEQDIASLEKQLKSVNETFDKTFDKPRRKSGRFSRGSLFQRDEDKFELKIPPTPTPSQPIQTNPAGTSNSTDGGGVRVPAPTLLPATASFEESAKQIRDALEKVMDKELSANPIGVKTDIAFDKNALTELGEQFEIIQNKSVVFGEKVNVSAEKLDAVNTAIQNLINEGVSPYSEQLTGLIELKATLSAQLEVEEEGMEKARANMELLSGAGQAVGDALMQASEQGKNSINDLLKVTGNAARKFIKMQIAQAIANAIKNAIGTGPVGLFLAPAAAGAAAALFGSLVPKFATGAIVRQPTLAMIGDNAGAGSNYEAVLRRDQLQFIANDIAPQGGGGGIIPSLKISGSDLLVVFDRATAERSRRGGF